jgi:hypothetical protein
VAIGYSRRRTSSSVTTDGQSIAAFLPVAPTTLLIFPVQIAMKHICALVLAAAPAVIAFAVPQQRQTVFKDQVPVLQEQFLVELSPGETRWVTEDEKWVLRRVCSSGLTCQTVADNITVGGSQLYGYNLQPRNLSRSHFRNQTDYLPV